MRSGFGLLSRSHGEFLHDADATHVADAHEPTAPQGEADISVDPHRVKPDHGIFRDEGGPAQQLIFHLLPAVAQQALAGNVRALAVLAPTRSSVLPDVPTTKEAGMPGLEAGNWYTVFAPAGTPKTVIALLNRQINATLADPVFRKRVMDMGLTVMGGTPADVTTYIASESKRWSEVVRSAGVKVD